VPTGTEPSGSGIVRITGRYRLPSDVVSELKHALAENPTILFLELHETSGKSRLFEVLEPVADYLAAWPGTVLATCVPNPVSAAGLLPGPLAGRVLLARTEDEALERAHRAIPHQQRSTTFLAPHPEAADDARTFTRRALDEWDLPELAWPASLVVSELVTHSIVEAQTALDLTVSRVDRRVRIGVHDYGADNFRVSRPAEPTEALGDPLLERGRLVVTALTRCWGVFPSRTHGKTVWAVMEEH
jgi:hypothetical protein